MIERAIIAIKNLFEDQAAISVVELPGDSRFSRRLIHNGRHAKPEIVTFQKEVFERCHTFLDLESFLAFLQRPDVGRTGPTEFGKPDLGEGNKEPGLVFVAPDRIEATLLYGHPLTHKATLAVNDSEEFAAIKRLGAGVNQKELWRLLITALDAKVDPALLVQISSIGIKAKDDREFTIRPAGLTQGLAKNALIVSTLNPATGEQVSEIRTDWVFHVRLWECFDQEYDIPTVLEIVPTDKGLVFLFHAKGLQDILRQARQDLVEEINAALPSQFRAYCGEYGEVK